MKGRFLRLLRSPSCPSPMNEDRASRFHRLRRRVALASTSLGLAALIVLLTTGSSADLAAWAHRVPARLPQPIDSVLAIVLYASVLALGWEILSFPFVFYGSYLLDRKYGLTSEPAGAWLTDHLKALGLGLGLTLCAALAVYGAIWLTPRWWWLVAPGIFVAAAAAISRLAPIWLMPIFYRFRPLDRDTLRARLLTLSARAGVPVVGAFEWGLGEKTSRANAALVGAGSTRRIL